jgi:GNAT superfamily N-acetyltransferase
VTGPVPPRVENLTRHEREAVIDVLCESFRAYPVMRFIFGPDEDPEGRLRSLIGFFTDVRFSMAWPVLGIREDGQLVAAALVNHPHDGSFLERFREGLDRVKGEVGEAAFHRLGRFGQASEVAGPRDTHYFVGMLGVLPERRGNGYARVLLEHVRGLSIAAGCAGVALSTEDPANLPFYEHMGFEVVGEGTVDRLSTWSLWWAND